MDCRKKTVHELYDCLWHYLVVQRAKGDEARTFWTDGRIMAVRWCPVSRMGERSTFREFCQAYDLEMV